MVGLYDAPRTGRRPKLTQEQAKQVKVWVKDTPQQLDRVASQVAEVFGKSVSRWTLKRMVKGQGMTWRRVRRGMPKQEDEAVLEKKSRS